MQANFPISKKSKNARMGKGNGSFLRWVVKLAQGSTILEFKNINYYRIKKLNVYWCKLLGFDLFLIKNNMLL